MSEAAPIRIPELGRTAARRFSSEKRLAERAQSGDQAAFASIFERYHQPIYRYCLSILRDPDDAKDALQSTMSSALRSLPGEQREVALRAWLFRVAHNHSISIIRARRDHYSDEHLARVADPRLQNRAEDRERLRELIADLGALPERQRAALTMRELSGLSFDEIATALGMSPAAARQAVYEARLGLRSAEDGRAMECETARELISAGDGRSLRALRMRAHLRGCAGCAGFRSAIAQRERDLHALCPPLTMVASAAVLQGMLGGAAGGAGATGGSASAVAAIGAAVGSSGATKAAVVLAVGAIGAGTADHAGLIETPLGSDERPGASAESAPVATKTDTSSNPTSRQPQPASAGPSPGLESAATRADRGKPESRRSNTRSHNSGNAPARAGAGGNPPAHSSAGGNETPGDGPPMHSNAGGHRAPGTAASALPAQAGATGPPPQAQAGGVSSGAQPGPPAHSSADSLGSAAAPGSAGVPAQAHGPKS